MREHWSPGCVRRSSPAGRDHSHGDASSYKRMKALLVEREDDLLDALAADLGKPRAEAWATDIGFVIAEIDYVTPTPPALGTPPPGARAARHQAQPRAHRAGAARRRARHRPVELSRAAPALAARRRNRCRELRGREAVRGCRPHVGCLGQAARRIPRSGRDRRGRRRRLRDPSAARRALRPHLLHGQQSSGPRRHGSSVAAP